MMRVKKQLIVRQVTVSDYAAEGKSLAKIDGKVIFITGAVPGDVVDLQLTKSKKDWAEARVIHFHDYSSLRTTPFCKHFGKRLGLLERRNTLDVIAHQDQ